ncbi:MAG: DUF2460 domain-containing protein [Pseudomonadota bacterium]
MSFHSVRFSAAISFGSTGGLERRTEVVTLANGHEERNMPWSAGRRRYDAGLGVRTLDDLADVTAFFEARRGRLHAFRWKDWLDHKSCAPSAMPAATDQAIGTGDGAATAFQLAKTYEPGIHGMARPITKPVAGTVLVALDGADQVSGWSLDPETGVVKFDAAPGVGVAVTAGFEFDVPVRFDTDAIDINLAAFEAGEIPSIPVIEVRV